MGNKSDISTWQSRTKHNRIENIFYKDLSPIQFSLIHFNLLIYALNMFLNKYLSLKASMFSQIHTYLLIYVLNIHSDKHLTAYSRS